MFIIYKTPLWKVWKPLIKAHIRSPFRRMLTDMLIKELYSGFVCEFPLWLKFLHEILFLWGRENGRILKFTFKNPVLVGYHDLVIFACEASWTRRASELKFFYFILLFLFLLFFSVNFLPLMFRIRNVLALLCWLTQRRKSLCSNYLLCSTLTS